MDITIYHNPKCGTSRNVLAAIKAAGYTPEVIEYVKAGWTRPQLETLFKAANLTPRDALRVSKTKAEEMGLTADDITDEALMQAMLADPILVNRPIVVTPQGTKLCRPSGEVLDLLPNWPDAPFAKEAGDLLIDEGGKRVAGA
jgi:arsenate reductase